MEENTVLMTIDMDRDKKANLLIFSTSFEAARIFAGKILVESRENEEIQSKIFQVEDKSISFSYTVKGMEN